MTSSLTKLTKKVTSYLRKWMSDTPVTTSCSSSTCDDVSAFGDTNISVDQQNEDIAPSDSMSSTSSLDRSVASPSIIDVSTSSGDTKFDTNEEIFIFVDTSNNMNTSLDDSVSSLEMSMHSTHFEHSLCNEAEGMIDTINERNAICISQRRASLSGIQVPWLPDSADGEGAPSSIDHDLIAERKFYKRAKSAPYRHEAGHWIRVDV